MNRLLVLFSMLSAGIVHLFVSPEHFGHAPAHGIFFVIAGIAEIVWAVAFWRKPSSGLYAFGILIAGGLLILWAITRVMPAPFEGVPGPFDFWGIYSKTAELIAIWGLIAMSKDGEVEGLGSNPGLFRSLGVAILMATFSGAVLFGAGQVAEPLFPSLAGEGHSEVGEDGHEHEEEHEEEYEDDDIGYEERVPNNGAVIRILSPSDDSSFQADDEIHLEIEVENIVLSDDEGHWHIYIDDVSLGMVLSGKTDATLSGLEPGEHEVAVYLSEFTHVQLEDGDEIHIHIEDHD